MATGDQGIARIEDRMLEGRADIAAHSIKDVPMEFPEGLYLSTILEREEPCDAFVSNKYDALDQLPEGAIVGTSSLRRRCQLLHKRYEHKLDEEADEFLTGAVEGSRRMRRLLDDLLSYSRVATQAHGFMPAEATTVLNESIFNLQAAIDENQAEVSHDGLPSVVCDATQLMQIFQNLIGNALKFHRPEVSPEVRVSARTMGGGRWEITVEDNGVGFDEADAAAQRAFRLAEGDEAGADLPPRRRMVARIGNQRAAVACPVADGGARHVEQPAIVRR